MVVVHSFKDICLRPLVLNLFAQHSLCGVGVMHVIV
jgi:hypothetical protein